MVNLDILTQGLSKLGLGLSVKTGDLAVQGSADGSANQALAANASANHTCLTRPGISIPLITQNIHDYIDLEYHDPTFTYL
jgi:hypothetical protein